MHFVKIKIILPWTFVPLQEIFEKGFLSKLKISDTINLQITMYQLSRKKADDITTGMSQLCSFPSNFNATADGYYLLLKVRRPRESYRLELAHFNYNFVLLHFFGLICVLNMI